MSHRTQITLTDTQYDRLRRESERTGVGLAELVRRALGVVYGSAERNDVERVLIETAGAWHSASGDGADYVEDIRRGLPRRLEQVG